MKRSPAQIWARVIGAALALGGAVGFAYSSSFGSPGDTDAVFGILEVNGFHNLVHLASGLLGLAMSGSYASARAYCLILAASYTLVAIWGLVVGDGGALLSIIPVNAEDNALHAIIALVSLIVGLGTSPAPRPSTAEPGPGIRYN